MTNEEKAKKVFEELNIEKSSKITLEKFLTILNMAAEGKIDKETLIAAVMIFFLLIHDELLSKGKLSLIEALKVGALIEEVDINDLQDLLDITIDNEA